MKRTLWGAAVVLVTCGCATSQPVFRARVMKDFQESDTLSRVAFELGCPKDSLTVTDVTPQGQELIGSQMGVSGCGKQAVYVRTVAGGWVNNSGVLQSKPADP